jgi:hypothetical protein
MADTLIWDATGIEIHKVVVGPVDNNVYVLRCTETGDAVPSTPPTSTSASSSCARP